MSKNKIEITSVNLKIKDVTVALTIDELKQLQTELNTLLNVPFNPLTYPWTNPSIPSYPWTPIVTYNTSDKTEINATDDSVKPSQTNMLNGFGLLSSD